MCEGPTNSTRSSMASGADLLGPVHNDGAVSTRTAVLNCLRDKQHCRVKQELESVYKRHVNSKRSNTAKSKQISGQLRDRFWGTLSCNHVWAMPKVLRFTGCRPLLLIAKAAKLLNICYCTNKLNQSPLEPTSNHSEACWHWKCPKELGSSSRAQQISEL